LTRILAESGIRAGLIYLNGLTSHRFSALYRFDDVTLKNLFFFDRENPGQSASAEIPVLCSYCVFVRDSGSRFKIENSSTDERTIGHPKRLEIRAYCGVPLLDNEGKMYGTVCHFDVDPQAISGENIDLMEALASALKTTVSSARI
jgi:GAF domain-containing protein